MTKRAFLTLCCFALPQILCAQETEEPTVEPEVPTAQVRAWIFNSEGPCLLRLRGEKSEEAITIAEVQQSGANIEVAYRPVEPGRYRVELLRGEEALAAEVVVLGEDSAQSVVAWPEAGKWRIKSLSDSPAPNATDKTLRLLHFNKQFGLVLTIGDGAEQTAPLGTVAEKKVAAKRTVIHLKTVGPNQEQGASSYFDVDFSSWPSAYVLAQADYRGRIKPVVIQGGLPVE
jgi:hypothetical protein